MRSKEEEAPAKRRGRKPRKPNEKEIMLEHLFEERPSQKNIFHAPKNERQEQFSNLLQDKIHKIIVVNGPAGTGKTLLATENGVRFLMDETYEKIIFTRPSVSVDEDLGFLPGTLEEKMAPWMRPFYDIMYRFFTPKEITQMIEDKIIEIAPLGFMRGRTFQNTWIVADEMQNATVSQMKMLMTRIGSNSKLVVTGDLEQSDSANPNNGLEDFIRRFKKTEATDSIKCFAFEASDVQREEVVKHVLKIYRD